MLRRGDKGPDVIELQNLLGLSRRVLVGVGYFGSATEEAVIAFQREHGLPAHGIVDGPTWAAIEGEA